VADRLVRTHEAPTGQVLCLITPDGQRTFAFHTGASDRLTQPAVASLPADTLCAGDLVYLDAYTLLCPESLTEELMASVARVGGVVGLNLCSRFVVEAHRERIRACVQAHVDLLVCNEEEAAALTGGAAAEAAAAELGGWCDTVVVTVGERGCWVSSRRRDAPTVMHMACDQPVAAVDTTGAGDFFAAGFVHGWLRGWHVERCVRAGNALGGAVVRIVGTALHESTWQSLRGHCEALATGEHSDGEGGGGISVDA
jgi:sugar/nucleoside kinase (ribokinase family)